MTPEDLLHKDMCSYNRLAITGNTDAAERGWREKHPWKPLPLEEALKAHRAGIEPGDFDSPERLKADRIGWHLIFIKTRGHEFARQVWIYSMPSMPLPTDEEVEARRKQIDVNQVKIGLGSSPNTAPPLPPSSKEGGGQSRPDALIEPGSTAKTMHYELTPPPSPREPEAPIAGSHAVTSAPAVLCAGGLVA